MCVILVSYKQRADFPLILIANRDEFYDRPTAPADVWEDFPNIYAGRDLVANGTWLGVTDSGRFAAVTNFRKTGDAKGILSRGDLVAGFLKTDISTSEYMDDLTAHADEFSGFNLLAGEINRQHSEFYYFSNRSGAPQKLNAGLYGLSNHLLDTPWPKVERGKRRFREMVDSDAVNFEDMFELLLDQTSADDQYLPETGVGIEIERFLSPIFIETPVYGTRCSTVLTFDADFNPRLEERVFR